MLRHLTLLIPTFLGATLMVFLAVRLLPGDVVDQILAASPDATQATSDQAREAYRKGVEDEYSLNENLPQQYGEWLFGFVHGDLGTSIISHRAVGPEVAQRLIPTAELSILAILISLLIAVPIGVLSAVRQNTVIDYAARSLSIILLSVPTFAVAILLLVYAFDWFSWSPPINYAQLWDDPSANASIMLPPAIILGINLAGPTMRLVRSSMLETLRQDYIRTARSKGIRERTVVVRHGLRNAMLPMVTVVGLQVPLVLSGVVILERIFSIPGLGRYMLGATTMRDYPAMQAVVVVSATAVILSNFLVERLYMRLDPRISAL